MTKGVHEADPGADERGYFRVEDCSSIPATRIIIEVDPMLKS